MSTNHADFGTVFSKSGVAGITNVYQFGSAFFGGAATYVLLEVTITTDASSTMTALTTKVQGIGTEGGADIFDVISYKLDTNTSQPELEHAYSALATGTTVYFAYKLKDPSSFAGGLRVGCKATFSAGSSIAGDAVTVKATGW